MAEDKTLDAEGAARVAAFHRFSSKILFFVGLPAAFWIGAFAHETQSYLRFFLPLMILFAVLDGILFLLYRRVKR